MLLGDVGDHAHLLFAEDNAGGIAGIGDHNGTGVLGDQALDPLAVGIAVALFGAGMQSTDPTTGRMDKGGVIGIVRFGDNNLRVGIQNAQEGQQQSFTAAGGDQNVIGLQIHTDLAVVILNGIDELGHTGGCFVLQSGVIKILNGIVVSLRCCQIRLTDIQMVDLLALFLRIDSKRVEFPHGRRLAAVCIDRNFHMYLHWQLSCPV